SSAGASTCFLIISYRLTPITLLSFFFLVIRRPPTSPPFPTRRSSDLRYALGRMFYQQGRYPEAVAQLERVVELEPDNYRAHDNLDRKSTRLNSSHLGISYAVFCLKKKKKKKKTKTKHKYV